MVIRPWTLQAHRARLELGKVSGCADIAHPELGIFGLRCGESREFGSLMAVATVLEESNESRVAQPVSVREAHVRGNDLIVKYTHDQRSAFRTEICHTATSGDATSIAATLALTVSIETDLLHSHPRIQVTTRVPAGNVCLVREANSSLPVTESIADAMNGVSVPETERDTVVLFRFPEFKMSYAEMTHPCDFQKLTVQSQIEATWTSHWRLFGQFLEKGVIRRARMQGVFVPIANDIEMAIESFRAFVRSEIPLTA